MTGTAEESTTDFDVAGYLKRTRTVADRHLDRFLTRAEVGPEPIHEAIRYSVFAGGKRLRPALALATGEALEGRFDRLIHLACALEMIHVFSLIHDDLPAMDDDDFRRGKLTLHKKYDEAIAVLAGDALLALAFHTLAGMPPKSGRAGTDDDRLRVILLVSEATGSVGGMIGGQVADIRTQGHSFDQKELEYIHKSKTGSLIRASVLGAALLSDASSEESSALDSYATRVGLAFQIVDDILDIEGSTEQLGKTSGKDQAVRKATYPALHGIETSRKAVVELVDSAVEDLTILGTRADTLCELARFVSIRRF